MTHLPNHGRIDCTNCFNEEPVLFDQTQKSDGSWRITANPLAWGNTAAEIVVLGFSKGPTQAGALASTPHDQIAYKGSRLNVGKILAHIGLMEKTEDSVLKHTVDDAIANRNGRFHFGSFIKCTVERRDPETGKWKGSGGGMLDKFVATPFGQSIAQTCATKFLGTLPESTKLVVMFGLGTKQNYVHEAFKLFEAARPGRWHWVNEVSYSDSIITVVHVEHFASQGALIPNWLGINKHERSRFGVLAKEAVAQSQVSIV
jgi:hypothetical protein